MTVEIFKQDKPEKITVSDRVARTLAAATLQQNTDEKAYFLYFETAQWPHWGNDEDDSTWPQDTNPKGVAEPWAANKADYEADDIDGPEYEMNNDNCYPDNDARDEAQRLCDEQDNEAPLQSGRRRCAGPTNSLKPQAT